MDVEGQRIGGVVSTGRQESRERNSLGKKEDKKKFFQSDSGFF